jgi:hypothetical protein
VDPSPSGVSLLYSLVSSRLGEMAVPAGRASSSDIDDLLSDLETLTGADGGGGVAPFVPRPPATERSSSIVSAGCMFIYVLSVC